VEKVSLGKKPGILKFGAMRFFKIANCSDKRGFKKLLRLPLAYANVE
jgi:hypothetical protein